MSLDHLLKLSNTDAQLLSEKESLKEEYLTIKKNDEDTLKEFCEKIENKFNTDLDQVFDNKEQISVEKSDKGLKIKIGPGDISIEIFKTNNISDIEPFEVKKQITFKRAKKQDFMNIVLSPVFSYGKVYLQKIDNLTPSLNNLDAFEVQDLDNLKRIIELHRANIEMLNGVTEFKYYIHRPTRLTGQANQNNNLSEIIDRAIQFAEIYS